MKARFQQDWHENKKPSERGSFVISRGVLFWISAANPEGNSKLAFNKIGMKIKNPLKEGVLLYQEGFYFGSAQLIQKEIVSSLSTRLA
ncbi:hypothetical protein CNR22_09945 [Sphingobacteriaceae bacterium]|nr:hypothetical protein CNR22_09945 [Sphingobacteriaceae bacterium]